MISSFHQKIIGLIAFVLFAAFILGLSRSISVGFAGFWGGFPFMIIAFIVLSLAVYEMWESSFKKK
jgi:hypothetical protein